VSKKLNTSQNVGKSCAKTDLISLIFFTTITIVLQRAASLVYSRGKVSAFESERTRLETRKCFLLAQLNTFQQTIPREEYQITYKKIKVIIFANLNPSQDEFRLGRKVTMPKKDAAGLNPNMPYIWLVRIKHINSLT
jgi:hypothetical protein